MRWTLPTVAFLLLATLLAAAPPVEAKYVGPECGRHSVLQRSYLLEHDDGTNETVHDVTGHVREGDAVTARLKLAPACSGVAFTLAAYEAPAAAFSRETADQQVLFDHDTESGNKTSWYQPFHLVLGPVEVPSCFFQVDLARGEAIERLGPADSENFYGDQGRLLDADNGGEHACWTSMEPPGCPADLTPAANEDGSITVSWDPVAGAEDYYVMRMVGAGEEGWQRVQVTTNLTWTDEGTEPGVTYTYWVMARTGLTYSQNCPTAQVTAVPFFGAPVFGALALAGSVLAFAWMRRR